MYDLSFWIWIIAGIALLVAFYIVTLRFGPRRGFWAQPAAKLRAPGKRVALALYAFAAMQLVLGAIAAFAITPSHSIAMLVIAAIMSGFYVACAQVMLIASAGQRLGIARSVNN